MRIGKRVVELCLSPSDFLGEEVEQFIGVLCEKCEEKADKIANEGDIHDIFNREQYCEACRKKLDELERKLDEEEEEEIEAEEIED
jgi:hypothetical protein